MSTNEHHLQPEWLDAHSPRQGRYVLGPPLGRGGTGEVQEAWDVVLCRTVALKVLKKMDPGSLLRFMHEARLHSRLVHPNICQIYDVDSTECSPRIAMQLVRGPTLAEAAGSLTVEEIVQILAQVADAVHAAHRLKLIHRDLKPSNILLERNPEGIWFPYVCDFGLAMELDQPALTAPLRVNGTPAYMAPEQQCGERGRIGPATDVFALGGTLHFALHGQPPQGPAIQGGPTPGAPRTVPRELEHIARKCMEPDPGLRYPSSAALAEELCRFRNGEPIQAGPGGLLERRWRRWRGACKRAGAVALACAMAGGAFALAERRQAAAARRRSGWERGFVLEAAAMERDLSLEKMLPVHDLRPAYAQLRSRLQALQERLAALGPEAQGAGHYALAQGRFLLGDWPGARLELERAGASGFRGPELAGLLAQTLAAGQDRKEKAAQFQGTAVAAPAGQVADLVRQNPASGDYGEAMVAYLSKDYARAFELARAAGRAQPWQSAADALAAQSLTALGRQGIDRDDFLLAEARFGTAMEVARDRLQRDPSDESMHHAYLLAACGLASLRLERGRLAAAFLARLRQDSETALRLNPGNPELQDDRLAVGILQARRLAQRGADPGPELDAALRFMAAWTREPLDAELRADRMLIHWLRAERAFSQGRDPEPALAQALLDPGHTPFLGRDYLGAVLNFKAQVEAARGRDPRPTLDQAMAGLEPLLGQGAPGFLCATAAQSWLIRGRWEAAHGLDASPSLRRARELAERGRGRRPRNLVAFLE